MIEHDDALRAIEAALQKVLNSDDSIELNDELHLIDSEVLDSLDSLIFLMELEKKTNVKFPEKELEGNESLYIVGNLVRYIENNR